MHISPISKVFATLFMAGATLAAPSSAFADNYALVMGISAYPNFPLPGVGKDIDNGQEIARLIGVPPENIIVKKDTDLTKERFPKVIEEFSRRIKPGDHVFVYYSGHGTSYSKPNHPGQCEKGIVTQDEQVFLKDDFHKLVDKLGSTTEKTFVFLDSCFSGGMVQATHSKAMSRGMEDMPRPKFASSTPEDTCAKASNYVSKAASRDFGIETASQTPNYYLLTAASNSQYAIDGGPRTGSYATAALLDCLRDTRRADRNGDGVVSLDEARQCAQGWIDERLQAGLRGNPEFPYTAMTMSYGYGKGGNSAVSFVGGSKAINTVSLVQTLYDGRDAKREVSLKAEKDTLRIGEYLNLELTSDKSGYVTLMVVGSSGRIYQIFPNDKDTDARIEAGKPLPIPRPDLWMMPAQAPAGDNHFLALVSDTPDRFKGVGQPAGIFKALGNTGESAKGIFERLFKRQSGCAAQTASSRDFGVEAAPVNPCATGYGASLLKVTEIE